jgi:anti-anti-sigma factor
VDIRVEREGDVVVLSLRGAIDIVSAPQLKAQFDQELLNRWAPRLVVDCAGVEYVDSYGLGIIAQGSGSRGGSGAKSGCVRSSRTYAQFSISAA